jgi:hypothetical protein
MKRTNALNPIEEIARIASRQLGPWYYLAAVIVAVLIVVVSAPLCTKWPLVILTLLAASSAFLGILAYSFHRLLLNLLAAIMPLHREAARLRATLQVTVQKRTEAEADRDRWKSAVEQAAGGPAGETPTDLIARQALRIRTLERALQDQAGEISDRDGGDRP